MNVACIAQIATPGTNQEHAMSAHVAIIAILVTNVAITGTSLHGLLYVTTVMPATAQHVLMLAPHTPSAPLGHESTSWRMQTQPVMLDPTLKTPTSKDRKKVMRIFDGGR